MWNGVTCEYCNGTRCTVCKQKSVNYSNIHAHWICDDEYDDEFDCGRDYHCSHCNFRYHFSGYIPKFCLDCGARMDEEANK